LRGNQVRSNNKRKKGPEKKKAQRGRKKEFFGRGERQLHTSTGKGNARPKEGGDRSKVGKKKNSKSEKRPPQVLHPRKGKEAKVNTTERGGKKKSGCQIQWKKRKKF